MSLHYLLDGYNIIHQAPALAHGSLEERRIGLVRWLNVSRPQGSVRNPVTVVFDGHPGMGGHPNSSLIKIVFSSGESADDYIKRAVSLLPHKKNTVVVTDDRDIQLYVRSHGAQVKSVDEFWGRINRRAADRKEAAENPRIKEDPKHISKTLEYKITAELEQIWLTKSSKHKKLD